MAAEASFPSIILITGNKVWGKSSAAQAVAKQARAETSYPDQPSIEALDRILRSETPRIGCRIDSSDLTLEETVDDIIEHLNTL